MRKLFHLIKIFVYSEAEYTSKEITNSNLGLNAYIVEKRRQQNVTQVKDGPSKKNYFV